MGKSRRKVKPKSLLFDIGDYDESRSSLSASKVSLSRRIPPEETDDATITKIDNRDIVLEKHFDALYGKSGPKRENALSGLVAALESRVLLQFVENKTYTLFQQFHNIIKRGSMKEACLASQAIGLLVLTIGCGDNAREIMEDSLPQLSKVLSGSGSPAKLSALDCLAIVSFVGGAEVEEREESMKIIWELLHPKRGSKAATTKPVPEILAADNEVLAVAVSAWTFLLTTIHEWRISSTKWKGSLSLLSQLLDNNDRTVQIVAGEAIAVIFETRRLDKFSNEPQAEVLKWKILNQLRYLSMEAGGKGSSRESLAAQKALFKDILAFIESRECPEVSLKKSSTWASLMQMKFLKRFLRGGFIKHIQDNELLRDVFDCAPMIKKEDVSVKEEKLFKVPEFATCKERTQFINKRRGWAQAKSLGHFAVTASED